MDTHLDGAGNVLRGVFVFRYFVIDCESDHEGGFDVFWDSYGDR